MVIVSGEGEHQKLAAYLVMREGGEVSALGRRVAPLSADANFPSIWCRRVTGRWKLCPCCPAEKSIGPALAGFGGKPLLDQEEFGGSEE